MSRKREVPESAKSGASYAKMATLLQKLQWAKYATKGGHGFS